MKWFKLILAGWWFVLLGGGGARAVQAAPLSPLWRQSTTTFAQVQAQFWPEFDKPLMLVILDVTLTAAPAAGSDIAFNIPAASGGPLAVAEPGGAGNLVNLPYTANMVGPDIVLTLKPTGSTFRVEYYDPGLAFSGNTRTYTFTWKMGYAVDALTVRVQQPAAATNLQTTPALAAPTVGEYGLNYYAGTLGAVAANQTATFQVQYNKPSNQLTADLIGTTETTVATPAAPAAGPSLDTTNWALILVAAVAGVLLGAGLVWLAGRSAAIKTAPPTPRRARSHPPKSPARASQVFCTQCGQPLPGGDSFCRQCGAKR